MDIEGRQVHAELLEQAILLLMEDYISESGDTITEEDSCVIGRLMAMGQHITHIRGRHLNQELSPEILKRVLAAQERFEEKELASGRPSIYHQRRTVEHMDDEPAVIDITVKGDPE